MKKGSTVVNLKSVASLNETKTEAVLEANVTNLVAGTYTLSFQKGEALEFAVEAAVVSSIEIISDVAVLHPTYTTQATARYQVKNQFGEDVTANSSLAAPNSKLTISGGTTTSANPGIVTFTSKNEYRPNVDIVALTIVCNTNGVNAQKTLTVSNKAVLDTVEFMGIYTTNKSGVLEKVDLKEKTSKADLEKKYWALFSGKDQYGNPYNEPKSSDDKDQLNVQITGVPGLSASRENALSKKKVNNVEYLAVQLSSAYDKLQSGSCTILAIPTMSGKTSSDTIEVTAVAKIDTVSIVTSEVLGGQENSLEYEILDTEGNLVTNYETIRYSGIFYDEKNAPKISKIKVERKDDGTANIIYTADSAGENGKTDNFSIISETNKVTFVTLNILENSVPKAVNAVTVANKKISAGENMAIISGHSVTIKASDLTLLDQHGKPFSAWDISENKPLNIKVAVKADDQTKSISATGAAISSGAIIVTSPSTPLVTITGTGVAGTITFTIGDRSCTMNITSTDITDVGSDVSITVPDMMYQGTEAEITVNTADGAEVPTEQYFILDDHKGSANNKIKAPELATGPAVEVVEKTFTITVTVNGKDYKQEVKYSNATPVVASATKKLGAAVSASASAVSGAATGLKLADLQDLITVKNQYEGTAGVTTGDAIRAKVTVTKTNGNDATATHVTYNNTANVVVENLVKGDKVTIEYTFKGTTYTSKQTFTVVD
ncbi:MAG: hypothetical protein HFI40_16195 [Lachnospiraceae bacterium]|nr:hypothetical protein [Lachnospiraceae bacterium]